MASKRTGPPSDRNKRRRNCIESLRSSGYDLAYEFRRTKSSSAPAFQSALREWVLSLSSDSASVAGKSRETSDTTRSFLRSQLLLVPGKSARGGAQTPRYSRTYVFDNDYPAMLPEVAPLQFDTAGLLVGHGERESAA